MAVNTSLTFLSTQDQLLFRFCDVLPPLVPTLHPALLITQVRWRLLRASSETGEISQVALHVTSSVASVAFSKKLFYFPKISTYQSCKEPWQDQALTWMNEWTNVQSLTSSLDVPMVTDGTFPCPEGFVSDLPCQSKNLWHFFFLNPVVHLSSKFIPH